MTFKSIVSKKWIETSDMTEGFDIPNAMPIYDVLVFCCLLVLWG